MTMPGLFSRFEGARQGDWAEARALVHTEEGVPRGWRIPSKALWVNPETSRVLWRSRAQASRTSHGTPGWSRQSATCPNATRDLAPLRLVGDAPLTLLGAGLGGTLPPLARPCAPHSQHGPSAGLPVAGVTHSPALRPAPVGRAGDGSPPASSQGTPRAGGRLGVAWPLPPAWQRGGGPSRAGSAPHLTLFWLLGD